TGKPGEKPSTPPKYMSRWPSQGENVSDGGEPPQNTTQGGLRHQIRRQHHHIRYVPSRKRR
ncbi:hypothetical protein A2U01_0099530, partial [Trifolium medium]|nr:hypothetical protein [Trifolium medium]